MDDDDFGLSPEKTRNLHDVSDGAEEEITMWPIEV